jgi:hypothetical protein
MAVVPREVIKNYSNIPSPPVSKKQVRIKWVEEKSIRASATKLDKGK